MHRRSILVLSSFILLSASAALQAATWIVTTNTTLGDVDFAHEGDDVVVRGATLTVNGAHSFASLAIERNASNVAGVLTHAAGFDNGVVRGFEIMVANTVSVQGASGSLVASRIDVSGKGFAGNQGTGAGEAQVWAAGGGHGGAGGRAAVTLDGGMTYGTIDGPVTFGSGGGHDTNSNTGGGAGGGVVRLNVGGSLTVDGEITAGGLSASQGEAGGGAGGSVWISADSIVGSGVIRANGGASLNNSVAGGGGGGRLLIHAVTIDIESEAQISAFGGGSGTYGGGAGTIVVSSAGVPATLIIDNGSDPSGVTEIMDAVVFDGDMIVRHGGRVGARRLNTAMHVSITGNCMVAADGSFYADGRGYSGNTGPEPGGASVYGAGAGHGGAGGNSDAGALGGDCYDSFSEPTQMGSGGGHDTNSNTGGGSGGGVLRVSIAGTLTVDGEVTADAFSGNVGEAGGGAGGSIWIDCGAIGGSGTISANGGQANNTSVAGGGGGGRIAVYALGSTFDDTHFSAGGGAGERGGAGTVWFESAGAGSAVLIVDNEGNFGETTEFYGANTVPGDLLVRSGGRVGPTHVDPLMHVTVEGNATIATTGQLYADGRGYPATQGTGAGGSDVHAAGAGHGGAGGNSSTNAQGGDCYGSFLQPIELGSGGGNDTNSNSGGGVGGGVLRLSVVGTLTVDGEITADASAGNVGEAGGGAGGSIWVDCGTIAGVGAISVNGGQANNTSVAGGGGGGRIAVYARSSSFDDTHFAMAGGAGLRGGGGTVWFEPTGSASGMLIVDNGGSFGESTEFSGVITVPGELLVRNGARLGPKHGDASLQFSIQGDAEVASGGAIYADGRGYLATHGAGAGTSSTWAAGGGHGGAGGDISGAPQTGGDTYGNFLAPTEMGSGGGNDTNSNTGGGAGGGVLRMSVAGMLNVDGAITAQGFAGNVGEAGGGAGGSIWIDCGALAGVGTISANGGQANNTSVAGGGGGGRVALYAQASSFADTNFDAVGGAGLRGGAGTVWFEPSGTGSGTLIVDNGGFVGEMTEMTGTVIVPGGVLVRAGGRLGPIHEDPTLALYVNNTVVVESNASIDADGRGYPAATGPGAGISNYFASGGGHGGKGGNGGGALGGGTYGSIPAPGMMGSGGGFDTNGDSPGGAGGGVISLVAGTDVIVNGRISAKGAAGTAGEAGGGAGGSVFLFVGSLGGSGQVVANGGPGNNTSVAGGGGGGRIAVYTCALTMTPASIASNGAPAGGQAGTALVFSGTVDIETQPTDISVALGGTAQFGVVATGDGDLTYRWRRNGVVLDDDGDIQGSATALLTIANISCTDAANYDCVVTDTCGFAFTEVATLTAISFGDLNGDCYVNAADIGVLLGQWGGAGSADLDHDGVVGAADLGMLLGAWLN